MASSRTVGTEKMNDENLKGAHLFDGVNYLWRDGAEYHGIFPVWDWMRVPGITWSQRETTWPCLPRGLSDWAGGVSDGTYGAASYDLWKDARWANDRGQGVPLRGRKAWIFFDREYVCLGAGIHCELPDVPVYTSVNQCLARGGLLHSRGPETASVGHVKVGFRSGWVWHDHVGYLFPEQDLLAFQIAARRGSWKEINKGMGRPEAVSAEVFSLWIDHGAQPRNASYQYVVMPGATVGEVEQASRAPAVEVVENSPRCQGVWHRKLEVGAGAFYEPGQVVFGKHRVEVDQPCLLLARRLGPKWSVAVQNPRATALEVTVLIDGQSLRFRLSGEPAEAGRPVLREIKLSSERAAVCAPESPASRDQTVGPRRVPAPRR